MTYIYCLYFTVHHIHYSHLQFSVLYSMHIVKVRPFCSALCCHCPALRHFIQIQWLVAVGWWLVAGAVLSLWIRLGMIVTTARGDVVTSSGLSPIKLRLQLTCLLIQFLRQQRGFWSGNGGNNQCCGARPLDTATTPHVHALLPLPSNFQSRVRALTISHQFRAQPENVLTWPGRTTWSRALPNDWREHSLDYILIARGSTLLATQLYSGGALPGSDYYRLREYKVHQSLSIWLRCPDTWSCKQCLMILWMRLCTVL